MKTDCIAHDDEGRARQFIVFRDNIGQFLVPLGIPATDPDIVQQAADATRFRAVVDFRPPCNRPPWGGPPRKTMNATAAAPLPAARACPCCPPIFPAAVPPGITPRFRLLVKRLRGMTKFTDAMAKALDIAGTEQAAPDLTTVQPDIDAVISGSHVEVGWGWGGYVNYLDMCLIQVDRADGKGYVDLCYDSTPGYNDTQPFPAVPTKWTYRAIYRVNDTNVGLWSKPVSIIVGG